MSDDDDVTTDAVAGLNASVGIDFSAPEWAEPSTALAALAMRERAAAMIETNVVETRFDGSRVVVPSPLAKEDQHHRSLAKAIRALPTTFTDAELLAAAMQLPEVRALVDAAIDMQDYGTVLAEQKYHLNLAVAIAPFKKVAS